MGGVKGVGRRGAVALLLAAVVLGGPEGLTGVPHRGPGVAEAAPGPSPAAVPGPAVAATSRPVAERLDQVGGIYVQPAVDLLRRLGIVHGDPDGSMRLFDTITRAELTKVVVVAMGLEEMARQERSAPPAFADVEGHWARGHIAVAKKLGITGGYGDGTFRPDNPVTNAEAITFLLRAAGLRPQGPWPDAYLNAARDAGVLTEAMAADLPPGEQARRGAVFLLAERAFTRIVDEQGRTLLQRVHGRTELRLAVTAPKLTDKRLVEVEGTVVGATLVLVNGTPVWPEDGRFTARLALEPGPNHVHVLATDDLGNTVREVLVIERR